MNQAQFEQQHRQFWSGIDQQLSAGAKAEQHTAAIDLPAAYHHLCQHRALASQRQYGQPLIDYLNDLAYRCHLQLVSQDGNPGLKLATFLRVDFPASVRQQWRWHAISLCCLVIPGLLIAAALITTPALIYSLMPTESVANLHQLYPADTGASSGSARSADQDLAMFGFYVRNNIGIALRAMGSGLLFGIGSIAIMIYNGIMLGAIASHLTINGAGHALYSFVIAHGAPELIAIVLAGGVGLQFGWAVIAPGQWRRRDALRRTAKQLVPVILGVLLLLLLAAFIEAFWSPRVLPLAVKYSVGGAIWVAILCYFAFSGRRHAQRE